MNVELSISQKEIVEHEIGGAIQVLASAGTGKTRVLTERIRLLLSNTKKDGVIGLTFTNKAAEEMSSRLSELGLSEERVWIGTVHSVAQRILDQYGHTIGLQPNAQIFERDKDRMEVFLEALRDDGVDIDDYLDVDDAIEKKNRERKLQSYMDGFSIIKRELLDEDSVAERFPDSSNAWRVFKDYQNALLNSGGIDYDDILTLAHRILKTHDWVGDVYRAKYRHICVDEAQDLNKIQYEFVKALTGDKIQSVMMVGDPDQMIYGFNGSSSKYLCNFFIDDFYPEIFKLTENFRSTKAVVRVANKLRPNSQTESSYAFDGRAKIGSFNTEQDEANWIVNKINEFISLQYHDEIEGEISTNNMAVIARNRFVFSALEKKLNEVGMVYNLRLGERAKLPVSLFGKILDFAIRLKINSKDWVDGRKLCQILKIPEPDNWGCDNVLLEFASALTKKDREMAIISDLLKEIHDLKNEMPNISKLKTNFAKKLEISVQQTSDESKTLEIERSIEELSDFSSSWTKFRLLGLGSTLTAFRNASALGKLHADASVGGVTLSTVHTMKGLEKDIVFLIGMCEGVFPDYRATTTKKLDEELNTAFVAVTRARRWLFMTYPKQRMMPWKSIRSQKPSRFIKDLIHNSVG